MFKKRIVFTMLCTAVLLLLCAGTALAEPDIILVQDENYEVVQYRVSDVQASQVLAADLFEKMSFAFENGYQVLGITRQNRVVDLNAGLTYANGYVAYENGVDAGTIPEGTYLLPDFAAEIDENGDLVLTSLLEGEAQIDVGQWIGSGYHVINNGFIDASSVSPYNAVDKVFLKEHLLNVSDTKADAQTYCSQKAVEIYNSINISTKASYSNIYFSGSVKADYSKATTTKRNETLIKHFAILRQSFVKYEPPSNSDLVDHRDARFIEKINHLGSSIAANNPPESIRNEIKDLYSQYGTHLILGYELGGRAEMNYAFSNQASMEESDIAVAVKASYKGIDSSASGSVKTKIQNNINQINTYSDLKIHFTGGVLADMTSIEEFKAKYADWVATVKSQPTMLNFPSIDNNLMPLWELTGEAKDYSDPNNQHGYGPIALAMYNCFLDLAHEQQGLLEQYDYSMTSDKTDYVMTDIGVWGSGTSEGALHEISSQGYEVVRLNPDGHGRYEIDANKGAGGDYLYIAYRMEKFRENGIVKQDVLDRAIVDIAITIGENSSKTNYEKVNVDLNATVGGDYIYLNYLRKAQDTGNKYKPLEDISGYYTKHFSVPYGWRNPSESHDLNRGHHGSDDIYLVVKPKTNM